MSLLVFSSSIVFHVQYHYTAIALLNCTTRAVIFYKYLLNCPAIALGKLCSNRDCFMSLIYTMNS